MKALPFSTNHAPCVERLNQFLVALFHVLEWVSPAHAFLTEKRACLVPSFPGLVGAAGRDHRQDEVYAAHRLAYQCILVHEKEQRTM